MQAQNSIKIYHKYKLDTQLFCIEISKNNSGHRCFLPSCAGKLTIILHYIQPSNQQFPTNVEDYVITKAIINKNS